MAPPARGDLPTYRELIYPTLRAVASLGGSAQGAEITDALTELLKVTPEQLAVTYDGRPKSVLIDRMDWARSYAKLAGALDSPGEAFSYSAASANTFSRSPSRKGEPRWRSSTVMSAPHGAAEDQRPTQESLSKQARARQTRARQASEAAQGMSRSGRTVPGEAMLARLHRLSPAGFEEFTLYLLRTFGIELARVGGVGDEGIYGIGLAPISAVLSSRVAVQAKRYDPTATVGREIVALFQRDAAAVGAERALLVTLARFSPAARKAATVTTPTVDLIDGDKLCDLVRDQQIGLRIVAQVDEGWFDRFDA